MKNRKEAPSKMKELLLRTPDMGDNLTVKVRCTFIAIGIKVLAKGKEDAARYLRNNLLEEAGCQGIESPDGQNLEPTNRNCI